MRLAPRFLLLSGIALISLGVVADTVPSNPISTSFLLGNAQKSPANAQSAAPAAAETPQAVNGTLWTVVAPTYTGTTSSYLRLFNGGSATATFTVQVVGSPSGTSYGTATIQVPTRASPQYGMRTAGTALGILDLANAAQLSGGDTSYSFYIQSTESTAGYQHVTFNTSNLFFENASSCNYALNHTIHSVVNSTVVPNIHTSLLGNAGYASQVEIHNYWNAAVTFRIDVIESATGALKGNFTETIGANTTLVQPMSYFQDKVGWTPVGGELHATLVITDPSGVKPTVTVGQSIINQSVQNALVNMSAYCAVNAPVAASSGGGGDGGGFGGGGISY